LFCLGCLLILALDLWIDILGFATTPFPAALIGCGIVVWSEFIHQENQRPNA